MELNTIINNIALKILDKNIKILYTSNNAIFDNIFYQLDHYIVNQSEKLHECFFYDMQIVNDFIPYVNNMDPLIKNKQLPTAVFIHNFCPAQFKKEDKIIFDNSFKRITKVFFTKEHFNNWNLNPETSKLIKYGIPKVENKFEKTKDILIINEENNLQVDHLHKYIKKEYDNTDILSSMKNLTLEEISNIIGSYKIVIDLNSAINCLYSTMCRCSVITTSSFDTNLQSQYKINDFSKILTPIKIILDSDNQEQIDQDINYIDSEYNYEQFTTNMNNIINELKLEPFII